MKAQTARENPSEQPKPLCGAVSPVDEPCNAIGEVYCEQCERWFCTTHAQDESWHACGLEPGDEGGEG